MRTIKIKAETVDEGILALREINANGLSDGDRVDLELLNGMIYTFTFTGELTEGYGK